MGGKLRTSMSAQQNGGRWMREYMEWENEGSILIQRTEKGIKHCLRVVVISHSLCLLGGGKTHKMAVAYRRQVRFQHILRRHDSNMNSSKNISLSEKIHFSQESLLSRLTYSLIEHEFMLIWTNSESKTQALCCSLSDSVLCVNPNPLHECLWEWKWRF